MSLSPKERVRAVIGHREPDRVPTYSSFNPGLSRRLRSDLGITEEDLGVAMGNDLVAVGIGVEKSYHYIDAPEYVCPWGITWHTTKNSFGETTEIVGSPLAGDEDLLDDWEIPDPSDNPQYSALERALDKYGDSHWIAGSCKCTLFEAAWYLRGMDEFMVDLLTNEEYVDTLLDKIIEFPRYAMARFVKMGVDMVWLGDDMATQRGMMISPDTWRRFFKPRYAALFSELRALNPGLVLAYHSCGEVSEIVDEMIEIGLDVLQPIQPLAMDPLAAKKRFGDRLTLWGGLDIQVLMPCGRPADVHAEALRLMNGCGKDGGYIIGGAHHFQEDTPTENIVELYRTIREDGLYERLDFEPVAPTEDAFARLRATI